MARRISYVRCTPTLIKSEAAPSGAIRSTAAGRSWTTTIRNQFETSGGITFRFH